MKNLVITVVVLAIVTAEEQMYPEDEILSSPIHPYPRRDSHNHNHRRHGDWRSSHEEHHSHLRHLQKEMVHLEEEITHMSKEVPESHIPEEQLHSRKKQESDFPKKFHTEIQFPKSPKIIVPEPLPEEDENLENLFDDTLRNSWEDLDKEFEQEAFHTIDEEEKKGGVGETDFSLTLPEEDDDDESDDLALELTTLPNGHFEPTVGTEPEKELQEPMVLPVTEGKNQGQDPVSHYGLPKELMPIHPGGGSRFEDLERERLEKQKMAQTKGTNGDSDSDSHDAEGLYSLGVNCNFSPWLLLFFVSTLRIV